MKNLLLLLLFVLPTALFSTSPSCVAGVEVSIVDASGKVIKSGKLNKQGKLTLSGIKEANWDVKLSNNGKSIVLGVNKSKGGIDKSTPLLFNAKISDYQDGDDIILRKRPGRIHSKVGEGKSGQSRTKGETTLGDISVSKKSSTDHNSTRSNKSGTILDEDSDNDTVDDDCDDAEIKVTDKGNGRVEITVTIL